MERMKKAVVDIISYGTAVVVLASSSTTDKVAMDLFDHRYYRLSKNLMRVIGQWPYQSARARRGIFVVIIFMAASGLPWPILALVSYRDDTDIVLECLISGLFVIVGFMKWIGIMWTSQKTVKLLDRIFTNWQAWARCPEVNILHEYAEQGEKMTIVYTGAIYLTVFLFTIQPMIPKIIDVVLQNGTAIGKFVYPVEYYYFDAQKYYYCINLHCYICASMFAMFLVASDSMLILYVQHICSVFAALGHKLEQLGNNDTSVENIVHLRSFIDKHNDAIEYANLIEATYTWNFFLIIGLGIILINILGVQILLRTNEPETTIRFIAFAVSLELVFYVDCSISQALMDHSMNVGLYIYNSQWYRLLPRDQKLLQLMTMRCRASCQLTAGKILVMSMSNFGLTFRTAMSYFAVVRPN